MNHREYESGDGGEEIEKRLQVRLQEISREISMGAEDLLSAGYSKRCLAAYCSVPEYLVEVMRDSLLQASKEDRGRFLLEVQAAIRTLAHGLLMGDQSQRHQEQLAIANGRGRLAGEIAIALKTANGAGRKGSDESTMYREVTV